MGYRLTLLCYIDVRYTVFSFAQKREFKILIIVDKLTRLQIINTLPSFHDPRSSIATMPSQFSGLFYVNEIINRDLHCYFMNENGDALPLTITYFYTRLIADSAPSTAAYIQVHAKKIYWLQGIITFPDQNFQSPMVSYFTAIANRSYKHTVLTNSTLST